MAFSFGCHEWIQIYANLDFRVSNLASLIATWCFPKILGGFKSLDLGQIA